MPSFQLNGVTLENVISYKYLGIIMHKNCICDKAIKDRMMKANRAIHMVQQIVGYSKIFKRYQDSYVVICHTDYTYFTLWESTVGYPR